MRQYHKLTTAEDYEQIILCPDACLFDQSMLVHILTYMRHQVVLNADLFCVDAFPGIRPYNGLGQLQPSQMASVYDKRQMVTDTQFQDARIVDEALAKQDLQMFSELSGDADAPFPWIPAALKRWN